MAIEGARIKSDTLPVKIRLEKGTDHETVRAFGLEGTTHVLGRIPPHHGVLHFLHWIIQISTGRRDSNGGEHGGKEKRTRKFSSFRIFLRLFRLETHSVAGCGGKMRAMPNGSEKTPEWARYLSAEVRAAIEQANLDRADAARDRKDFTRVLHAFGEALKKIEEAKVEIMAKLDQIVGAVNRVEERLA